MTKPVCLKVSRDVWCMIAEEVTIQDLLALRATCKHMNKMVKSMKQRWYRAWQWFVIQHLQAKKVRSAVRSHTGRFSSNCISMTHKKIPKELQSTRYGLHQQRLFIISKMIKKGELTEMDCECRYHWKYIVPKTEQDIPLDKNFKPKRNRYIYWYLIECYRYYGTQHNETLEKQKSMIEATKNQIKSYEITLQKRKAELPLLERKYKETNKKYKGNNLFAGVRINGYKGV